MTEGKEEWCVASEDCAFGPIGYKRVRDVLPGEMIVITDDGMLTLPDITGCWFGRICNLLADCHNELSLTTYT